MVEYKTEDNVLKFDCNNWVIPSSIEDSGATMAVVVDTLSKVFGVERIVMVEEREIEYGIEETQMLIELAKLIGKVMSENILDIKNLGKLENKEELSKRIREIRFIVTQLLRKDPIAAYVRINQLIKKEKDAVFVKNVLIPLRNMLENIKLIRKAKPFLKYYKFGDRSIYRKIFSPIVRPPFMLTRFVMKVPTESRLIDKYEIRGKIKVEIYQLPGVARFFYRIIPPEFVMSEDENKILQMAKEYLAERRPKETETTDYEKTREFFMSLGRSLIRDISKRLGTRLSSSDIDKLTEILIRYTIGFGVLEIVLADDKVQDVYINAPVGSSPLFVNHTDYGECETNIIPTREEAESWATRFRLYSGRPLDEANPVLDTEITVAGGRARVTAITRTLSLKGLAFAFRRHRKRPWTFPLFIKAKFFDPLYAGVMSFLVDGGRSILIAGGRGSGKTSLLNAMLLELMRNTRIIVVEDTPELSIDLMRRLGYNIIGLKSRSVITQVKTELPPEEALRTALRLGDSVLIVGEVRSKESVALFEAMRIGALANLVAGTIHGESTYGVYDRVVHDLGVVPTSFKALDIITIANVLRSPDGLKRFRRVIELTEVRKEWKEDPMLEGGFYKLMEYSAKEDKLKPTDVLLEGESEVLNEIAKRVREWHGAWDKVWENILLRAKIKKTIVDFSEKLKRNDILEADWVVECNEMFHIISNNVLEEVGSVESKRVYERCLNWFKKKLKEKT